MQLNIKVIPNASRDEVMGWQGNVLKIKVRAAPEDGKANKAVCRLLAAEIGCRPRDITISLGEKSRSKQLDIPVEKDLHSLFG